MKSRCLFCPADASVSRSVEHVIPESLWNTAHVLPAGIVCDDCNNYFAREVEKPFLESPMVKDLRFEQGLPNKRGRIPPVSGIMLPGHLVHMRRSLDDEATCLELPEGVTIRERGTLIFPCNTEMPSQRIVGRLLAKMAIEAMALRTLESCEGLHEVATHPQLHELRTFARRGQPSTWPIHVRRIYSADQMWPGESGLAEQTVHEFDILVTDSSEYYFVFALFGVEFVINYGGPEIDGYRAWLQCHNYISPLYHGKNAAK